MHCFVDCGFGGICIPWICKLAWTLRAFINSIHNRLCFNLDSFSLTINLKNLLCSLKFMTSLVINFQLIRTSGLNFSATFFLQLCFFFSFKRKWNDWIEFAKCFCRLALFPCPAFSGVLGWVSDDRFAQRHRNRVPTLDGNSRHPPYLDARKKTQRQPSALNISMLGINWDANWRC